MGGNNSKKKDEFTLNAKDSAVLKLKQQRVKLHQNMTRLESQRDTLHANAKALYKAQKKNRALLLLKRKKVCESTLTKITAQLENVEQMVMSIEFASMEQKVARALKEGNDALVQMNKLMSIEDVEMLMEDSAEAMEYQNQINELLGMTPFTAEDDEDIQKELEELTSSVLIEEEEFPEVPVGPIIKIPEKESKSMEKKKQIILE